jgi:CelD/BcsL family acetyltransferase involved in cellulose biosynthesis
MVSLTALDGLQTRVAPAEGTAISRMEELRVEILRPEAAAGYIDEWRHLAANCLEPNGFLEPGFALAAARHLFKRRAPHFLFVWDGAKLLGICPLQLPRRLALWSQARVWTHNQAPLGVPLLDRGRAEEALAAILAYCRDRLPHAAGLLFPMLPQSGPTAHLLSAAAKAEGHELRIFAAHERAVLRAGTNPDWRHAVNPARRRKLQKARKKLEARGALSFRLLRQSDELGTATEQFLALEAKGWKGQWGTALLQSAPHTAFARSMMSALSGEEKLSIARLDLDGIPLAMAVVLESNGHALYWKVAYDEDFASFSPGVLMSIELSRVLLGESRVASTDSCASPGQMIEHVWRERMGIADFFIALGSEHNRFSAAVARESARRKLQDGLKEIVKHVRRLKAAALKRSRMRK